MKNRRRRQAGEQVCFLAKGLGRQECQREAESVDPAKLPTFNVVVWVVRDSQLGEGSPLIRLHVPLKAQFSCLCSFVQVILFLWAQHVLSEMNDISKKKVPVL